jgi:hypothetical protein
VRDEQGGAQVVLGDKCAKQIRAWDLGGAGAVRSGVDRVPMWCMERIRHDYLTGCCGLDNKWP